MSGSRKPPAPLAFEKHKRLPLRVVKAAVNQGSVKRVRSHVVKTVAKPTSHTPIDETGLSIDITLLFPPLDD